MKKIIILLILLSCPFVLLITGTGSEGNAENNHAVFNKIDTPGKSWFSGFATQFEEIWVKAMHGWRVHDMKRPQPPIIDPGTSSTQEAAGKAPSDAIILFDGNDLSKWERARGGPVKWLVKDGYAEVIPGTGDIRTLKSFGDCQLHLEWRVTEQLLGDGHDSGNSGVILMSKYEIQVFDSYRTKLYADGAAGAIYGEFPPDVDACIAPGKWQTYDIIFHPPHFDSNGSLIKPALITILFNGVLVQDNTEILGPTRWMSESPYEAHPDKLPLTLQDHNNPVRFRNIWIRPLPQGPQDLGPEIPKGITLSDVVLEHYAGSYGKGMSVTIEHRDGKLMARIASLPFFELVSISENELIGKRVDSRFVIDRDETGNIKGLTWYHSGVNAYCIKTR